MPYPVQKRRASPWVNEALASAKYATALVATADSVAASINSSATADVLILETHAEITQTVASHLRKKGGPRVVIVVDAAPSKWVSGTASLQFAIDARTVTGPHGAARLSRVEAALLACLLHSRTAIVTRSRLRNAMFLALRRQSSDSCLSVHIHNIRAKLRTVSDVDLRTLIGRGYELHGGGDGLLSERA